MSKIFRVSLVFEFQLIFHSSRHIQLLLILPTLLMESVRKNTLIIIFRMFKNRYIFLNDQTFAMKSAKCWLVKCMHHRSIVPPNALLMGLQEMSASNDVNTSSDA